MDLLTNALTHPHPLLVHFPIALLFASWALDVASRRWPQLRQTAWIVLLLGTIAAIPTAITGIIAHFPYEESAFIGDIERHEQLALSTTALFIALAAWRWWRRRNGDEIGSTWLYLGLALVGLVLLTLTGANGGYLVYDLGVGVRGVAP